MAGSPKTLRLPAGRPLDADGHWTPGMVNFFNELALTFVQAPVDANGKRVAVTNGAAVIFDGTSGRVVKE